MAELVDEGQKRGEIAVQGAYYGNRLDVLGQDIQPVTRSDGQAFRETELVKDTDKLPPATLADLGITRQSGVPQSRAYLPPLSWMRGRCA